MRTVVTELRTEAVYSENGERRFLLRKTWNEGLPKLAVIMLCAGSAGTVELDTTTQLVLNNAARLGYGSVAILNLFPLLNDFSLKHSEEKDIENVEIIVQEASAAEKIVFAPGTGKTKNALFLNVQEQTLLALRPYEKKLFCLCDEKGGGRLQHPLSPRLRQWHFSKLSIAEVIDIPVEKAEPKKKEKSKNSTKKTEK